MGNILRDTQSPETVEVRRAQADVEMLEGRLGELATEAGLLAASNVPVLGTFVDIGQGIWNAWNGRWGEALLDVGGVVPGLGDGAKSTIRGTRIAKAVARVGRQLDAAKDALSRARLFARRRAAATRYWRGVRGRRNEIMKKYKNCKTKECAIKRDKELRQVSRLPATGGRWLDAKGNPAPAGSGYWKPDPGTSLAKALEKHPNGSLGVPFRDGKPDFSGFPAPSTAGKGNTVEIEMSGNSRQDVREAGRVYHERTGIETVGAGKDGTWHHEPDGVTMTYVDKRVHTAYKDVDGAPNSGTPHAGGDSMSRDPHY